jgi:hypothetical protein
MSYEPSHRRPPRQERWPNATPGEGWPAYQQDDGGPARESAEAFAGTRNGYATTGTGYGGNGYGTTSAGYGGNGAGDAWGGRNDEWGGRGGTSNGYGDAWDGGRSDRYGDPGQGYWPAGNAYGGTTTAYPAAGGYADGFDGAADGYATEYASPADGYATEYASPADGYATEYAGVGNEYAGTAEGYGGREEYYETPGGWDGYGQPGHEFTGSAGYLPQEQQEYPDPTASSVLVAPDTMGEWWRQAYRGDGRELGRGPFVGAMTGLLAAAVAIGVATLAAAFVRPQASPVTVVGGVLIDWIPATLRNHLMAHFGAHGQTLLLLGALGFAAIVLGCLARRNASIAVAGLAAFGLLGAFVAITRPESRASDVIPSAIGGLAGIVALLWLVRAAAPTATAQAAYSGGGRRRAR